MNRSKVLPEKKKLSWPSLFKLKKYQRFLSKESLVYIGLTLSGFLVGRIVVFQFMNPSVIPYISCFLGSSPYFLPVFLAAGVGIISQIGQISLIQYVLSMSLLCVLQFTLFIKMKSIPHHFKGIAAFTCILFGGLVSAAANGMSLYFALVAVIEAVIAYTLTHIFQVAGNIFKRPMAVGSDAFISASIFLGVCFVGMADFSIRSIPLRDSLSMTVIMVAGYCGSMPLGAAAGLVMGIIMILGAKYTAAYIGILGIAGMCAGIFKDFGKVGTALGFCASGLIATLYLNRLILGYPLLMTFGLAAAVFLVIPASYLDKIKILTGTSFKPVQDNHYERAVAILSNRLLDISKSFYALSRTFDRPAAKPTQVKQREATKLIDLVAEQLCKNCVRFESCWKENFYSTYQVIFSILATCEKKGSIKIKDIPQDFYEQCIHIGQFLNTTNQIYDRYANDNKWIHKISESRELVSEQLLGMSQILSSASKEFARQISFDTEAEKEIQSSLALNQINTGQITALINREHRMEIYIHLESCGGHKNCTRAVEQILSQVTGREFVKDSAGCEHAAHQEFCQLRFIEKPKYKIAVGSAIEMKSGNMVSGDSFTSLTLKDGQHLVALSDGMGSGEKAARESMAAIDILEHFLDSGFEKDFAIKMINSALILKSDDEIFSTLDIFTVNLYTGYCEIIKTGAVETFLIRNGAVRVIRSSSLPIGILSDIDLETTQLKLQDGDIMLMVSDGISDAKKESGLEGSDWITGALDRFRGTNPKDIADYIVFEAKKGKAKAAKDDMTALCIRIWECP